MVARSTKGVDGGTAVDDAFAALWRRLELVVGFVQITGSLFSVPVILGLIERLRAVETPLRGTILMWSFVLGFVVCGVFILSFLAGVLLLANVRWGRILSVVVQVSQLLHVSVGGVVYVVVIGWGCFVRVWPPLNLALYTSSKVTIDLWGASSTGTVSVNLLAMLFLGILSAAFMSNEHVPTSAEQDSRKGMYP